MDSDLYPMLMGAVAMSSLVATLFFWRFWTQTRDTLFLFFTAAFGLDAAIRVALALSHPLNELETFYYLARLVTFGLIIGGVVHKNRPNRRS